MEAAARQFVVSQQDAGQRVDRLLAGRFPEVSRGTLQRWIQQGNVHVDGERTRPAHKLRAGQRVEVSPADEPRTQALPDPAVEFEVLYEDSQLLVVNKPAGLVVHPARGHWTGTLVNGLLCRPGFEACVDEQDAAGHLRPGIVHRLDKDTSGAMVVAKTPSAREALKQQIASREMRRVYEAIVVGVPAVGTIESFHARHPTSRLRFSSKVSQGKRAVTHIEAVYPLAQGEAAHIQCRLETGRTHQIRVHLAEQLGCPLLGDDLYGKPPRGGLIQAEWKALGHHALHARSLTFVHPSSGALMQHHAKLPPAFSAALARLGLQGPYAQLD